MTLIIFYFYSLCQKHLVIHFCFSSLLQAAFQSLSTPSSLWRDVSSLPSETPFHGYGLKWAEANNQLLHRLLFFTLQKTLLVVKWRSCLCCIEEPGLQHLFQSIRDQLHLGQHCAGLLEKWVSNVSISVESPSTSNVTLIWQKEKHLSELRIWNSRTLNYHAASTFYAAITNNLATTIWQFNLAYLSQSFCMREINASAWFHVDASSPLMWLQVKAAQYIPA